ncbi:maleylpyruvate isomerase family mycothiol-dependent enzyme [Streptomyces sp. NPDC005573]|uniref:maleylpyruvate isomerase family mycothiol-dependent enzyme n=1 Tax=Streptomyces sp. NPDC005573 TaxID=3156890 RepID=UPI0033BC68D9
MEENDVGSAAERDVRAELPEGLETAVRDTAAAIAALLRGGADGMGVRIPGALWSAGEAAAHLALANELMAELAAGSERPYGDGTPQSLAAANEASLAAFGQREAEPLAAMIEEQAEACLRALRAGGADTTVVTPLGTMSGQVLGSYLLTHMLGHGYDLARALGRPHMLDADRVELTLPFLTAVMERVTEPARAAGTTASYAIRLWSGGSFGVRVEAGTVRVDTRPPERPDCTIAIEPVTFLLMALGRLGQWSALARGRILVRGRRPWLAPRFPGLFTAP